MQTKRTWPIYTIVAVVLVLAVMLFLPTIASADSGTPGQSGICVTGQVIDKSHRGLEKLTVTAELKDQSKPGISVITDANGKFTFNDLLPGAWMFRVTVPDSWEAVTPAEFPVTLAYGQNGCYEVRFKLNPVGCVIVKKTDANGKPLADWKIILSGPIDPEKKTDANGVARFDGLTPGTYIASETVPYPWKALTPASVTVKVQASQKNDDCAVVEFKNERQPTACITGFKVDDQHKGLPGWKITAKPAGGTTPVFTAVTEKDGSFTFKDLTLGTWTLSEELQKWWTAITPASFNVTLTQAGDKCVEVRFKNRAPDLCAEGYKVDEKGMGLAGWTVKAYSEINPAVQMTTTTDANGYYRFVGLTLGKWNFEVQHQTGWTAIGSDKVKIDITGGGCTKIPTFHNQSPRGCVEGYKRDDLQVGLPGWNISLQPVGGGLYQHRDTDGTGYFRFDGLPMGKYQVWEELQSGWAPLTPTKYVVEVVPTDDKICSRVEFVNKQTPRDICIDGNKLDWNGKVGLPGFTVTAKNVKTGAKLEATTDGLGYFRFGNLAPGSYEVSVTEKDGWAPVGATKQVVAVDWPPAQKCKSVTFYNRQKTDPVNPSGCRFTHVVQSCQTLSGLAVWYGVPLSQLMAANGITNPNKIYVGQKLCIP
jgi:uncharacterized surface anchored protein